MEQSRRDDLEAIGLILIYFSNNGFLPWMKYEEDQNKKEQLRVKQQTTLEMLCQDLPPCFLEYMKYCRNLKYAAKPDYKYLRGLLDNQFNELGFENDGKWEWITVKEKILEDKIKAENEAKEREAKRKQSKLFKVPNKREQQIAA